MARPTGICYDLPHYDVAFELELEVGSIEYSYNPFVVTAWNLASTTSTTDIKSDLLYTLSVYRRMLCFSGKQSLYSVVLQKQISAQCI